MMTWLPKYEAAQDVIDHHHAMGLNYRKTVSLVLQLSGALAEINRLTALLDAATEANKTLNAENRNLLDSYDSGYRAA